ncbi:creatininase family protein [Natronococcus wangiae]|uniref:creatininase family protein n=1 Tax=Natronococcus wangiae TaxID=3068275 RepID=UPI00273E0055|nr:creatininase family protein [Natronococcus sp. AD5]
MLYETIGTTTCEWAGKPYAEIQAIGDSDGSVLAIPVGSIEQHGHHLPVSTDTLLVDAVTHGGADRIADEIPILVTPPVWSGYSPHHLSLGGTLSLDFEQLQAILEDLAYTGIENGFDAVIFVNGHGGNMPLIDTVVSTVGCRTDVEVLGGTYFQFAIDKIDDLRESQTGGMAHGGEFETSLMLYLRSDLVADPSEYDAELWDEPYEWGGSDLLEGGPLSVYRPFEAYSESGAIGAPEYANKEKGEQIYHVITNELAALFTAIHEENV